MDISAHTALVGLMGWPVEHSASPVMHNAAFAAEGLDWAYVALPVAPEAVASAVRGLAALGFRGANVTVPHKQAVLPYLDSLTEAAQLIGAVNTIWLDPGAGTLHGDNTDAAGFIADLREHDIDPGSRRALVLGAGGAARAVVVGLAQAGCPEIRVLNRSVERAAMLVAELREALPSPPAVFEAGALSRDVLAEFAPVSELVINSTSVGMSPETDGTPWDEGVPLSSHQVVYDLVYRPARTRFMSFASACGARTVGGLGMLLHQGALAFTRWTGVKPRLDVMRSALLPPQAC